MITTSLGMASLTLSDGMWECQDQDPQPRHQSDKRQLNLQVGDKTGSISEGTFHSFPETKKRGGEKYYQFFKILFNPTLQ